MFIYRYPELHICCGVTFPPGTPNANVYLDRTTSEHINKLAGVQTDCSVSSMNVTLTLEQEFQGVLYARGFPLECRALGSLQSSVTLQLAASGCGVRITPNKVSLSVEL